MWALFAVVCVVSLSPSLAAHQPCHTPNMTGIISTADFKNPLTHTTAQFVYDPLLKRLHMRRTPADCVANTSRSLDLLLLFDEGFFYEIDSKNQSCTKKVLNSDVNSMDVSPDATFLTKITLGSQSVAGEGLALNLWRGSVTQTKGVYFTSVTMGCMPVSTTYISSSSTLIISHLNVETEIKDPEKLNVPSFCEGEETHDDSIHTFFNLFF